MNITDHILVIGLGSIGLRHTRNLMQLGAECISVVTSKPDLPEGILVNRRFATLAEALSSGEVFSAALVCTPTAMHSENMMVLLDHEVPNIYLEKPVGHDLAIASKVGRIIEQTGTRVLVGYDLHFDPGIAKIRGLLAEGIIGKPLGVNAVVGQYLPDWRPHEDYRHGMSASKERGGGVMLDLVHEIDYLRWLFGFIAELACFYENTESLEIETEDLSHILCRFNNGVIGTISLDYLQRKLVRYCRITGSEGSILWNLAERKLEWTTGKEHQVYRYENFERNDRFIEILRAFLYSVNDERLTTYSEALHSLAVIQGAKESSEKNKFIKISS